jgi:hypothetical protein
MIKIEVTGNSIPEVADKLLAIGASLRSAAINAADDAAREALQAKRNAANNGSPLNSAPHPVGNVHVSEDADINPAALTVVEVEVAEAAPVDPTSSTSAIAADVLSSQPTTREPSTTPAPAPSASELSFETDVTPVVLAVVQTKGKPVVEEILSQFGVARASQLDPARWPELVAALKDQL